MKFATKKPIPAAEFGMLWDKWRGVQADAELIGKPGRCHPFRSPNNPPSLSTPRTLSGYLRGGCCQYNGWSLTDGKSDLPFVAPDFPLYFPSCEVTAAELIPADSSWASKSFRYNWAKVRWSGFWLARKEMAYSLRPR